MTPWNDSHGPVREFPPHVEWELDLLADDARVDVRHDEDGVGVDEIDNAEMANKFKAKLNYWAF